MYLRSQTEEKEEYVNSLFHRESRMLRARRKQLTEWAFEGKQNALCVSMGDGRHRYVKARGGFASIVGGTADFAIFCKFVPDSK